MSRQDKMVGKPFNPDRRCHWFDSSGRPYKRLDGGLGCPRSKGCYFAHPTDGEYWRNARISGEPPLQYLTDDEYRLIVGRARSPGRALGLYHYNAHHQQHHIAGAARHRSISPGRKRERSPGQGPSSITRRRTDSRERVGLAASPPLAQRIRGRRSISREREYAAAAAVRTYGRSSRSRSPVLRGRARTPPPVGAPRGPRPYSSVPDGPRNGNGNPRNPMVPKVETGDVTMKDVASVSASGVASYGSGREESIASTRVSSRQPTSGVPAPASVSAVSTSSVAPPPPQTTTSATTANAAPLRASSSVSNPDAIKNLLESSKLQWQHISTAVAAATSAVPKGTAQGVALGELSAEEKHKIWSSRIELLAAATRIHNDCRSMENDIRDYKQLVESFSYQTLPAEDKTVIESHLHTLQGQLAQKTEDMKKIITNLSAAKFWPTHTSKQSPAELDNSGVNGQQKQDIANKLGTLKGSISQLQLLFKTVDARWENLSNQLQTNHSASSPGSGGGNAEMASSMAPSQASGYLAQAIVPAELEKIRNTLANFEDRMGALERGVQQDQSLIEQLDAIVAENVQAVVLASTGTVQAKPPEPRAAALTDEQLRMLQALQQNAAVTEQHVARLSQEVAQLAGYNERLQTESMALQAENVQLRQQLEELQNTHASSSGDSTQADRMISEMRALNAAVRAYISQSSSSTQQPAEPTGDAVVKQLAPYLVKSIPELIAPQLQGLQETLRATQTQVIQDLSTKMTTTLQTVEAIRDLMVPADGHPKSPTASSTQSSHHEGINGVA